MNKHLGETYHKIDSAEMEKAIQNAEKEHIRDTLDLVYAALLEKGYDPKAQLIGYILTEDPIYITSHNNARVLICKLDKFDIMNVIVEGYFGDR